MIGAVLGVVLELLRPGASGVELLVGVGLAAVLVAVVALIASDRRAPSAVRAERRRAFDRVRVLLRASDPDAVGHHRARAPGTRG